MTENLIVDTHTHICNASFDADRGEVLHKAATVGVSAVIAVAENLDDARRNIELAEKHPMIRPAAGLYPTILDLDQAEQMYSFIRQERAKLVAIGEVGLDFWVVKEAPQKELQKEILKGFINLSYELDLPLNIHSRSAGRHAVALLLKNGATRVQMHAFDGKASTALPAVEAGFFFSIPPSVVRSRQKQKLVKHLPLSCLLVETDSPVLGPDPKQRNEPANVTLALKAIMDLKSAAEDEVLAAVSANTRRLYGNAPFDNKLDAS
ncbi:MAG: TatD family hydrolase [Desulfobacteraceae bacterium]|jgi:TatD DNase family protein|nr:TatD family hydrolase [Desulfobacteraceae bacterium]